MPGNWGFTTALHTSWWMSDSWSTRVCLQQSHANLKSKGPWHAAGQRRTGKAPASQDPLDGQHRTTWIGHETEILWRQSLLASTMSAIDALKSSFISGSSAQSRFDVKLTVSLNGANCLDMVQFDFWHLAHGMKGMPLFWCIRYSNLPWTDPLNVSERIFTA